MLIRYQLFQLDIVQYTTGISYYFFVVALAGWWNTPTFSPIGVLSASYDGNYLVSHAQDWAKYLMDSHWLPVISGM
jgi:hypothetical protein